MPINMKPLAQHPDWPKALEICQKLKDAGFTAWLAGGCVRDALLGRKTNDFDVATDATPDQVEAVFEKSIAVGKAFGVIVIPFENTQIEVATFRSEGGYTDGRRPEKVAFTTPEDDAKRRDFTVNGLFYDPFNQKVHDFVGGEEDLKKKVLRAIGDPEERFTEDHLRVLRGARFASQLGFNIEKKTYHAMKERSFSLDSISYERKKEEMRKLFKTDYPFVGLQILSFTGLLTEMLPEFDKEKISLLKTAIYRAKELKEKNEESFLVYCWACLFGFVKHNGLNELKNNLEKWKFSRDERKNISFLLQAHKMLSLDESEEPRWGLVKEFFMHPMAAEAVLLHESIKWSKKSLLFEKLQKERLPFEKKEALLTGVLAQKLTSLKGKELGALIKEAYLLQLEGKFESIDDVEVWVARQ